MDWSLLNITLAGLREHYRRKDFTPSELLEHLLAKVAAEEAKEHANPIWISRFDATVIANFCRRVEAQDMESLPLFGVPFAIKDNIDLKGLDTTAACPAFAYSPEENAFVVERLIQAGAIPIGKTNLDQFATGLVGVRSPYGVCRNALNERYVSGGSSSGSALAVALGQVSFALGTDTAGSGRVPAAFNNIVGVKPTRGLLSTRGLVPACRSLDCISIFANNCDDASEVMDVCVVLDAQDSFSRPNRFANTHRYYGAAQTKFKVGVPQQEQLEFFRDQEAQALFQAALVQLENAGAEIERIDFSPFSEAARLLYEGPWVAERYLAAQSVFEQDPEQLLPVIRTIIGAGKHPSACDAFAAQYRLQALLHRANAAMEGFDCIVTPTTGTTYQLEQVAQEPIALNSNLGYYTNFMNLFDLAAVAVPTGFWRSGVGFGITLFSKAWSDKQLLCYAAALQNQLALHTGQSNAFRPQGQNPQSREYTSWVDVVVCGAHLEGLALNWQLRERGGYLREATCTSPCYQLYALPGGPPYRPALVRQEPQGEQSCAEESAARAMIEVEVWRLPVKEFGAFVAEIPAPLGMGKVELVDGRWLTGFICEPGGLKNAKNITSWGSWRAYAREQL